jgi:hypothetical protein
MILGSFTLHPLSVIARLVRVIQEPQTQAFARGMDYPAKPPGIGLGRPEGKLK